MDQLCYQVDPNEYKHQIDLQGDLSLSLFINHNEDKEMALENTETMAEDDSHEEDIIIGTIEPLMLKIGNEYNLNNVKEISVTDDFLTLDKTIIKCQNQESLQDCKTR